MGERRLIRLTVPQTPPRQIGAIRGINHGRTFPIAERSPAQVRDVGDELIESRINKINELQFEYGALSVRGQTARNTENGRFSER